MADVYHLQSYANFGEITFIFIKKITNAVLLNSNSNKNKTIKVLG